MPNAVEADISGAVETFRAAGVNVHKALPQLLARLSFKGEGVMKMDAPVRTGTLRRSIHAYPTIHPAGIAAGVNYAFAANVRSSRPGFIEKTKVYITKNINREANVVFKKAFEGMNK